ncbi:hypothetical protein J7643_02025 [bacterium]|nr:hypothetical protein [bacterium]
MRAPFLILALAGACMLAPAAGAEPTKPAADEVTGLVLDTRGLNYEPRMSPRVYDDSAHDLLAGVPFDPDKVMNEGVARWVRAYDPEDPNPRTGSRPLILKPLRIEGGDRLVLSGADAAKLKAANSKDKILDRMRILIIY